MTDNISTKCVVCKSASAGNLVANPGLDMIVAIKESAIKRAELGELNLKPLAEYMTNLSPEELKMVRYHSTCRKKVVHKQLIERALKRPCSSSDIAAPWKAGRPSTSGESSRVQRSFGVKAKEKICVFSPCSYEGKEDLHQVTTDNRGKTLLEIKERTRDDRIRTCLSSLHEPGDASAQEKWYHSSCLQDAVRGLPDEDESKRNFEIRHQISDAQIIMFVEDYISTHGSVSLTEINNEYAKILHDHKIEKALNQKKYLKALIKDQIPNIEFVQPPRRNESEKVVMSKLVREAIDFTIMQDASATIDSALKLSRALRSELLAHREEWKFTGKLNDFNNPPILQFLLEQILLGPYSKHITGRRDNEFHQTVDVLCQIILQNVKTDRQVKYKPKSDTGFVKRAQTPVSIGLPLAVHQKVRNKSLVNFIADLYLGSSYESLLNLQERVACGVVERMKETGGYVLPRFVKKNRSVFFAIDNIDFLEDTACGQNTLHGTIIVINQEEDEEGEPINDSLFIPSKPVPVCIDIVYHDQPIISPKPVKFNVYNIDEGANLLALYKEMDRTWALSNYLGNIVLQNHGKHNASNEVKTPDDPSHMQMYCVKDSLPLDNNQQTSDLISWNKGTSNILEVSTDQIKSSKPDKKDVMPTWAATNSLLILAKGTEIKKTNSAVIAPLFKQPPTDYATLYTALQLTQNISAVVVGPDRKTVITLDLDLYERALKIQQSTGNSNWVLRAGELHICMAAEHALAKHIESSGLDAIAIETSIYSPAALRAIFTGKAFKRGVEYHIMNALACFYIRFDAILGQSPSGPLRHKCEELRKSLHEHDPKSAELFREVQSHYSTDIGSKMSTPGAGELANFLDSYTTQVEALLHLIRACRQNDWEGFLAALDEQIKYFMAHDLFKYARLMPVHLAEMKALKETDPLTWEALKNGDFCVRKSDTPFTSLFVDQTLEQEIKKLKGVGGITGLTQQPELLDRFLLTLPELTQIVTDFQKCYSRAKGSGESKHNHYQLSGDIATRVTTNALKLKDCILLHCEGNPYTVGTPLKNIVSSMIVPEVAKSDILQRDEKGQLAYRTFVNERLRIGSAVSIWDPMKKLKLKTHSTWMGKQKVRIGDKVIKLREERQLLARFLVIQQSRPELVLKLPATIGDYEMSVIPRSLFATDGSLLIPTDKSCIMHAVENQEPADEDYDDIFPLQDDTDGTEKEISLFRNDGLNESVIIFDAMGILQSMKKTPTMKKICHLKTAFVKRISYLMRGYSEGRVLFDRYLKVSLKDKTRAKRAQNTSAIEFVIHDEMNIAKVPLRELLSSSKSKAQLTVLLAKALLESFKDSEQKLVVSFSDQVRSNRQNLLPEDMTTHNHEEADTMIPLHVLDVLRETKQKDIDVWSPDTDVLILLIDLVACGHLGEFANLRFLTGKGAKYRAIDIPDRVSAIGAERAKGLIGLHHFTGADWGGKFVGLSKKTWVSAYLQLPPSDQIVQTFANMGNCPFMPQPTETHLHDDGSIPERFRPLERFICRVYSERSEIDTLPTLRWELFRKKNLEGEKLPPTRGTLLPHILRANYMSARDKSYISSKPQLPPLELNGWEINPDGSHQPVKCLREPAPQAVLELVKCGCRGICDSASCSCLRNGLSCTPLCKCTDCSNVSKFNIDNESEYGDL